MSQERKVKSRPRPLSPHLQVYKPQMTSMISIMHRATGVALYISAFLFAGYLYSLAFWQQFDVLHWLATDQIGNYVGLPVAFGLTFALCFHFCSGIRHLFWDAGKGYDIKTAYKSAYAVIFFSLLFTIATWAIVIIYGHNAF